MVIRSCGGILLLFLILTGFLFFPGAIIEVRAVSLTSLTTNLTDYPSQKIPLYKKMEITFTLDTNYSNPFDPDEIKIDGYFITPTKTLIHPAFYYQNYLVSGIGSSETYTINGNPVWKLRFTPREVGTYQFYIKMTDKNGTFTSSFNSFVVVDSAEPGFIRASTKNNRYFEFDNGQPYIGRGLNIGWWQEEDKRITFYQYYLNRMAENQANFARIWMTNSGRTQNWIMSVQDKSLGRDYNLEEAWAFDYILDLAEKKGVVFLLTLDDINQYTYNWGNNLYNTALGGPCADRMKIFTDATAKKYQKQLWRYIIGRWAYSPNILSWEFFNEVDELQWSVNNWDWQSILNWHREMAQYIKSIDAFGHLTNTSTGSFKTHTDLYQNIAEMDFAQIHFYYVPGWPFYPSDPEGHDMANLMRYYSFLLYNSVINKPSIVGEWGLVNENWTESPYLEVDDKGVFLHNGLWASLFSGMASTGLTWHWASYKLHDLKWWSHYKALANYLANIDISNLTVMRPVNVDFSLPGGADNRPASFLSTNNKLRAMGLRNDSTVYVWVQNADNTWWNYVNGIVVGKQSGKITVLGLIPNLTYKIEHWDSYSGLIVASTVSQANTEGNIDIQVDNLASDFAVKIIKFDDQSLSITPTFICPPGDLDNNCRIEIADFILLLSNFLGTNMVYDLNKDKKINIFDSNLLIANFGR